MATIRKNPQKALAESLKAAKEVSQGGIVMSSKLERRHREILTGGGWLIEIIKGWNVLTSPGGVGSTAWYGGFWAFIRYYLAERFGEEGFCLSPDTSLNIFAGDTRIPEQIIVLTKKASNTTVSLPHNTSLLLITDRKNFPEELEVWNGIKIMPLPLALCRLAPAYYRNNPENIEIILKLSSLSVAAISRWALKKEALPAAERIIGAYEYFGETAKSEQLKNDLIAAGYSLEEKKPFENYEPSLGASRAVSPYVGRIRMLWSSMREGVLKFMPKAPGTKAVTKQILKDIQEVYRQDAYHSLSIEGYQVSEDLIAKIESGEWDPDNSEIDRKQIDALAAKGYQTAFEVVLSDISQMLKNQEAGQVFEKGLQGWYRNLFSPSVRAGLLSPEELAGYRNLPVFIQGSRHVPPPHSAVPDCMETLFDLLKNENNAFVRAALGHFIFVYIHPYMDGNGRVGRFLMNFMLISGGYKWMVIRVEERDEYMAALESASVAKEIEPFAEFILKHFQ